MCGICGMVAARGQPAPARANVERAVAALRHRGPDDKGYYAEGPAAFGQTRLAIIDLERGDQPMPNEDGTVVAVYNGEIWNHLALRLELERAGHVFRSRSDTEVLVHGWEEWGEGLLERLDGMFAFALWDAGRGRLLLGRDRTGKKPLYVAETEAGLAFGSDARSVLLVSGREPELAMEHVPELLFQRYVGAPRTLFRGIRRLRPGAYLLYDGEDAAERTYWSVQADPVARLDPVELRALLRDAAARRLMSDVPLGVLLSGGVDSAAVLGLMREAGAGAVASFTIGFDEPLYDEREAARITATRFGTDHHELVVGSDDFLAALPRLAWFRDDPVAEPSEVPLLLLAELAGRHVKVVLSGDGGDELFGGYPKYRAERLLRAGGRAAAAALGLAGRLAARRPSHRRLDRAVETAAIRDEILRWASWFRTFSPVELSRLVAPDLVEAASAERLTRPLNERLAPYAHVDAGRRMLLGDLFTYLPDNMLLRADKVLMGASVEGRMPLLDVGVVERAVRAPASQRAGLRHPKAILREALGGLVPEAVLRLPKRGFPVPVASLLLDRGGATLERLLLSERTLGRGLLRPDEVRSLVNGEGMTAARELKLFTLASLEFFLRTNVDRVRLTPPESLEELLEPAEEVSRSPRPAGPRTSASAG
jgi:asparagine synthase (glutamine-hydrolysing)